MVLGIKTNDSVFFCAYSAAMFLHCFKLIVMYAIKNNVQLVGSIVDRPLVRDAGDGRKVARFTIFIEDSYNNAKGLRITDTQSHTLVAQGKIATLAEKYLDKDMMVAINGRLINRNFRDSRGSKRTVTEVQVSELLILDMQVQEQNEYYGC